MGAHRGIARRPPTPRNHSIQKVFSLGEFSDKQNLKGICKAGVWLGLTFKGKLLPLSCKHSRPFPASYLALHPCSICVVSFVWPLLGKQGETPTKSETLAHPSVSTSKR